MKVKITSLIATVFVLLAIFCASFDAPSVLASDTTDPETVYAVMPNGAMLYSPSNGSYSPVVTLPSTHYVAIDSSVGSYYYVHYGKLSGYVRQSAVTKVDYEPLVKYAVGSATLLSGIASVFLYEDSALSSIIGAIDGSVNVEVYGTLPSQDDIYYVRAVASSSAHYGYLPSQGMSFTLPPPNDGKSVPSQPEPTPPDNETTNLSLPFEVIIGIIITIPSAIFVLLLFLHPSKKSNQQ